MQEPQAVPVLFVKHTCPFCLKVRLFLMEAGLIDQVELRETVTASDEDALRTELSVRLGKASFPTARFGTDDYVTESDDIIARFAALSGIRPENLPTFRAYTDGPFAQLLTLHRENADLRRRLE